MNEFTNTMSIKDVFKGMKALNADILNGNMTDWNLYSTKRNHLEKFLNAHPEYKQDFIPCNLDCVNDCMVYMPLPF